MLSDQHPSYNHPKIPLYHITAHIGLSKSRVLKLTGKFVRLSSRAKSYYLCQILTRSPGTVGKGVVDLIFKTRTIILEENSELAQIS